MKTYKFTTKEIISKQLNYFGIKKNIETMNAINKILDIVKERQHLESTEKVFDLSEECIVLDWELMQTLKQPDIY